MKESLSEERPPAPKDPPASINMVAREEDVGLPAFLEIEMIPCSLATALGLTQASRVAALTLRRRFLFVPRLTQLSEPLKLRPLLNLPTVQLIPPLKAPFRPFPEESEATR